MKTGINSIETPWTDLHGGILSVTILHRELGKMRDSRGVGRSPKSNNILNCAATIKPYLYLYLLGENLARVHELRSSGDRSDARSHDPDPGMK